MDGQTAQTAGAGINEQGLRCGRCDVPLELLEAKFSYLGHEFRHKLYKCPRCGQAFVPEALATGKISEVEALLEDK